MGRGQPTAPVLCLGLSFRFGGDGGCVVVGVAARGVNTWQPGARGVICAALAVFFEPLSRPLVALEGG